VGRHIKEFHGQIWSTRSIFFLHKKPPKWTGGVSLWFARVYEVDTTEIPGCSYQENVVSSNLERFTLWLHQTWFAENPHLVRGFSRFHGLSLFKSCLWRGIFLIGTLLEHSFSFTLIPCEFILFQIYNYCSLFHCLNFRIRFAGFVYVFFVFVSIIWTSKDDGHSKGWGAK
jgi:hypothetical protein